MVGHYPLTLGNDQPFFQGSEGDSRKVFWGSGHDLSLPSAKVQRSEAQRTRSVGERSRDFPQSSVLD